MALTRLQEAKADVRIAERICKLLAGRDNWTWILEKVREEIESGVKHD